MKKILIIGGTRNMGYYLARDLWKAGYQVTILNRGVSRDTLPDGIHRLHADRSDAIQMRRALLARAFDIVVDFVVFRGSEAEIIVELLDGNVGHYIMISTGQVYLVREGIERPYTEDMYDGLLKPAPDPNSYDYSEWLYGKEKRDAENVLIDAHHRSGFPYTVLRLPMVNSERDTMQRLYAYYLRLKDGGPILAPDGVDYPLRHVYGRDVVRAIMALIENGKGIGRAYNISQDETVTLGEFLNLLGAAMGVKPQVVRVDRRKLEANGFLPDCSPFSDRWMSELDNTLSKRELGIKYTPLPVYVRNIARYYDEHNPLKPVSYKRRPAELQMVEGVL